MWKNLAKSWKQQFYVSGINASITDFFSVFTGKKEKGGLMY